jgi:hypothetical protein
MVEYEPSPLSYASTTRCLNAIGSASAIAITDQESIQMASTTHSTEQWG